MQGIPSNVSSPSVYQPRQARRLPETFDSLRKHRISIIATTYWWVHRQPLSPLLCRQRRPPGMATKIRYLVGTQRLEPIFGGGMLAAVLKSQTMRIAALGLAVQTRWRLVAGAEEGL